MATILVVDDAPANRDVLVSLLRHRGHRMLEACNGVEGLEVVRAEHPDLVITDMLMPAMDGFELVRQLRVDRATSGIPVVLYTAHYGEREARELARSGGVADVLTKPVEPLEVLAAIDRMLGPGEQAARPVATPVGEEFDREHLRLVTDKLSDKTRRLGAANARLRALVDIGLELASERDAERLLRHICSAARDLFGATYVTLGILDRTNGRLTRLVVDGTPHDAWVLPGDHVPAGLRPVIAERRVLRGSNVSGQPAGLPLPPSHPPIRAFLAAPVSSPAHVYGWICLVKNDGGTFAQDDESLVTALSGQVGRAYENSCVFGVAQAERDRAQRYFDTAEAILLALDVGGRITQINRYACSMLGWTAEELVGRNWFDTCLPARIRPFAARTFASLLEGDLAVVERPILTRAGEERLVEWRNTLLRDDAGNVVGTFSSGTDITDRHRAEEEVNERARLSALSAEVGLALADEASLSEALRRCAQALVTHLGAVFARIWTLDDRDRVLELQASAGLDTQLDGADARVPFGQFKIGRIAAERKAHLTNMVVGDREVNQAWARREGIVAFAGHPLVINDRVVGVMALFARHPLSDSVTASLGAISDHVALGIERHRGAEALRRAEERMRFALQAADIGIWDMDCVTGALRWSETLEAHYGLQAGTFEGTFDAFVARIHADDRAPVVQTIEQAVKSGGDFAVEHRVVRADGTVRWLRSAGRILLNAEGSPLRGVGISMDLTERRSLEAQYQQAQKMEAVGRLAGGVAHDFNNLLTAILAYCELLLDDKEPADGRRRDILEIQNAGTRAAALTRQLLAFSRKQIVEPTLLDLNAVVRDMHAMLERLIGEDVKVVLELPANIGTIKADRGQMEQIVLNLAVNARDAMPNGGTLTIETADVELGEHCAQMHLAVNPGSYVALVVTDTGTGMTPDVQARLFEPFFTTKDVGRGTGLGLATVHGIVERSGGAVRVNTEIGRGSSFKVYLPKAAADSEAPVEVLQSAPRPAQAETVLLVEDADPLRHLAKRLLERLHYTVLAARNAEEALGLFEQHPAIDVILTDVVMPGTSGPELVRRVCERRRDIKVIYMSGYTEDVIVSQGVLKGGVAFLQKPFTYASLGRKLSEVLDAVPKS